MDEQLITNRILAEAHNRLTSEMKQYEDFTGEIHTKFDESYLGDKIVKFSIYVFGKEIPKPFVVSHYYWMCIDLGGNGWLRALLDEMVDSMLLKVRGAYKLWLEVDDDTELLERDEDEVDIGYLIGYNAATTQAPSVQPPEPPNLLLGDTGSLGEIIRLRRELMRREEREAYARRESRPPATLLREEGGYWFG